MTKLLASFGKPFKFQVAAFRLRLAELKATTGWDKEVWQAEHDRAFMVAGAIRADILADLAAAVDKAISQGTTLETFRKDFRKIVAEKGWQISPAGQGTKGGEAWRTKVIYKTNLSTSYAAGRFAQLTQAGYPFLVYRHGASVEPRIQHLAWDGLVLPADHPFWKSHCPPNGWGCTCYITGARSKESARRMGGKPEKTLPEGWQAPDPKTGAPVGIDRGWAYAPGADIARTLIPMVDKLASLPAPIGADLVENWSDRVIKVWSDQVGAFITKVVQGPSRGASVMVGALKSDWVRKLETLGAAPASSEIALTDEAVIHMFRDAKQSALDLDWVRQITQHLRSPDAVILDRRDGRKPGLLLVFKSVDASVKLVVTLDYKLKRVGILNHLTSGSMASVSDLKAILGKSGVLLEGSV